MKNNDVTPELLHKALEMGLGGMNTAQVEAATKLSHSQYDWARYVLAYWYGGGEAKLYEPTPENVRKLRDSGLSQGQVMVRFGCNPATGLWNVSASKVNSLYEQATGTTIHGTRNGKGGAWLGGVEALYQKDLHRTGTVLTPEQAKAVREQGAAYAEEQLALVQDPNLRAKAEKAVGKKLPANFTPAMLVRAMRAAQRKEAQAKA